MAATAQPAGAEPAPLHVVISQVYGGGGNTDATHLNDFVELFNPTSAAVSLDGWSIQYASATGSGNFGANTGLITPLSGSIAPGRYYLVLEASNGPNGTALPATDMTDATPISMSATAGKVALVNSTNTLGCNGGSALCSPAQLAQMVDLVGYGTANFYEGSGPAPAPSNTTADQRKDNGKQDTGSNSADFTTGTPRPHNSSYTGGVVISQVYSAGGNAGALYRNDFVELFNAGTAPVSIAGWSVQYASASGSGNFSANPIVLLSGTLQPAQYYLVREGSSGTAGALLPTPDATGSANLGGSSGKVALINSNTGLECNGGSTPCSSVQLAQIVDLVGYGTSANFYEGSGPAPAPSVTTADLRKDGGYVDTNNNVNDFLAATPDPRNSTFGFEEAPSVTSTTPANGSAAPPDATVTVTFSEPVNVTGDWFSISCGTSGAHAATVSGGPTTFTLDPTTDFAAGDSCTVTIARLAVSDVDTVDPPDNMTADKVFGFTVPPLTAIPAIQGASHLSPFNGQSVMTTGVVTALRTAGTTRGFYVQDPTGDDNAATSDGVFVFTGGSSNPTSLVTVGDSVRVTAKVSEYHADATSLGLTELVSPYWVTVLASGTPLPTPIVIGTGGRTPPTSVIEDDATGNVETSGIFDPDTDGIDFYESLEGMRVQVNDAVAVSPTRSFGTNREIAVVGDDAAHATTMTPRGGVVISSGDFNPERIILNDWISAGPTLPDVNVGDKFAGATVGVMDYSFGNFKLQVASLPSPTSGGLTAELTTLVGHTGHLSVATFNAENLAPTDPPSKFSKLASQIVTNLKAPDLLAIEEIQDDNGTTDNGNVDAGTTIQMLIAAIADADGPTYDFRQIDPVNGEDGGAPGGNIRQVFLFRTDRGLSFVDRSGGGSTTATSVESSADGPVLSSSPGRIDPTAVAFDDSRKPLAGEFMFSGHHVFVIANHFNSKSGDDPLFGKNQPPTLTSEIQRTQQAAIVHDFVSDILTLDANADVVVLGDLNDFQFANPITTLKGAPEILTDLIDTLPANERYTYVYDGNSEVLDHILVSPDIVTRGATYDAVHVNAEFADQASDHDPQAALLTLKAPLTVTADDKVVQYSDHLPTLTVSYDGFMSGEDVSDLGGALSCTTTADVSPSGQVLSPSGTYAITCSGLTSADYALTFVAGELTVAKEDTLVRLAQSNPHAVQIEQKTKTAPAMTFTGRISEVTDASYGDINKATPVSLTLSPVGSGSTTSVPCSVTSTQPATTSDPGFELVSCGVAAGVGVNVYEVRLNVGGKYYAGGDASVLTVYDPTAGGSNGAGTITNPNTGNAAEIGYSAKYLKNGKQVQGNFLYVSRDSGGQVVHVLKGNVMSTMAISGTTAKVTGKATLDGVGNYTYILTGIDNGNPNPSSNPDEYGQRLMDSSGAVMPELTFDPVPVSQGDIFVGKQTA